MTKQESPEQNEDSKETYVPKKPRSLLIIAGVFVFLVLLALGGIATALFSHSEDPESIKIPARVARSLADEQPAETANAPEEPIIAPDTPVTLDATQPPPAEQGQTESQINLNAAPSKAAPPAPALIKPQEKTAPQSMIEWSRLPHLAMGKAPKIVVVIDDMGLNHRNSLRMAQIDAPLTLSYMAYAENLPQQTALAAKNGHELIVHVPMEPQDMAHNNPGPNALLKHLSAEENVRRLDQDLTQFEGYIGLNNHMGSAMTSDRSAMRPVMAEIKRRGLWFLDSRTAANSVAAALADEMNVPYVARDVFLDNDEKLAATLAQLHKTEILAQHRGYAVAIGHPYDTTVQALQQWLPQARARGFEIVPLSEVIAQRFPNVPLPRYARAKDRTSLSENTSGRVMR